jgi:hypothetical protein
MTNATQTIIPAANAMDAPGTFVILPTSVPAAYVGVFGKTFARTQANFAAFNAPPSVINGVSPALQPGYMSAVGFPVSGLGTAVVDFLGTAGAFTILVLARATGASASFSGMVGALSRSVSFAVYGNGTANSVDLVVSYTDTTASISVLPVVNAAAFNLTMFSGSNGNPIQGQNLTVGGNRSIVSVINTKAFKVTSNTISIGADPTDTSTFANGSSDIAQVLMFPSVLSAPNMAAIEAWCRSVAVLQGITV